MGCVFFFLLFGIITLVTPSSGFQKNEGLPAFDSEHDGIEIEAPEFVQTTNEQDGIIINGDNETNNPILQTRSRGGRGGPFGVGRNGSGSDGGDGVGRFSGHGFGGRSGRGGRGGRGNRGFGGKGNGAGVDGPSNFNSPNRAGKPTGEGARRQKSEAEDREGRMQDEAEERARVTKEEALGRGKRMKEEAEERARVKKEEVEGRGKKMKEDAERRAGEKKWWR